MLQITYPVTYYALALGPLAVLTEVYAGQGNPSPALKIIELVSNHPAAKQIIQGQLSRIKATILTIPSQQPVKAAGVMIHFDELVQSVLENAEPG